MKKNVKVIGLVALVLVSIYSGVAFKFPQEWGWNFVVNVGAMSKTFLALSTGITLLRLPKIVGIYRGAKDEK